MNFDNSVTFFKVVNEELQVKLLRHELNERKLDTLYTPKTTNANSLFAIEQLNVLPNETLFSCTP